MKRHSKHQDIMSEHLNNKIIRKRNIIWFNPPFSKTISTKIDHYFLR